MQFIFWSFTSDINVEKKNYIQDDLLDTSDMFVFQIYVTTWVIATHTFWYQISQESHCITRFQWFGLWYIQWVSADTKSLGLYQYFSQRWRWRSRGGDLFQSDMVSNKNFWVLKLDFVKNVILFSELVPFKLGSRINIL